MHQNAQICMLQFKFFTEIMFLNPHIGEGLWRPFPNPIFLGTPALRASHASLGASIVPQCLLAVNATAICYSGATSSQLLARPRHTPT